jgi:hypothetical protein
MLSMPTILVHAGSTNKSLGPHTGNRSDTIEAIVNSPAFSAFERVHGLDRAPAQGTVTRPGVSYHCGVSGSH